jgi:uncharacterized membrane protein YhhN
VSELAQVTWAADAMTALGMPVLIMFFRSAYRRSDWLRRLISLALVFSWLGDVFGFTLLLKIIFFFVAHIFYIIAFWPYRDRLRRHPLLLAGYGLAVLALLAVVAPPAGPLAPAVVAYGILIGAMAVLATGVHRLSGIGAAIFLVSDTMIIMNAFLLPGFPQAEFLIMATYLTAQLLIILGVLRNRKATAAARRPGHETSRSAKASTAADQNRWTLHRLRDRLSQGG